MLAKVFGEFVLKSRLRASLTALACSLVPFLGWLAAVVVAIITLRKGWREGLLVLLWAALPAIAWAVDGQDGMLVLNVLAGDVIIWLLAIILAKRHNWSLVLHVAVLIGLLGVVLVHVFIPDAHAWWMSQVKTYVTDSQSMLSVSLNMDQLDKGLHSAMQYATGMQAILLLVSVLVELAIARNIQMGMEGRQGLSTALRSLRMNPWYVIILIAEIVLAVKGPVLFRDLLPVVLLPFFLSGVSLVHGMIAKRRLSSTWLVGFYLVLVLVMMFIPPVLGVVVIMAVVDSFINFRAMKLETNQRGK